MLLQMENIVKKYGSLVANDTINLTLEKGEILAVIGENGAGKTTLMKILYGLEQANSGNIYINEKKAEIKNALHAIKHGIGMVQQHFMLFEPFTVAENVVYGNEPKKHIFMDMQKANDAVRALSEKYELTLDPKAKIEDLSVGLCQRVEILKVLYQNTDIIIFDEPTAVLTPQEVSELLKTMKKLKALGKSIIIITHKLHEVMEVADRVMVMRNGHKIDDVLVRDTTIDKLAFAMIGRQPEHIIIDKTNFNKEIVRLQDVCLTSDNGLTVLDNVSLSVNAGEIVGIAGVSGNGQSELIRCIFGLLKTDSGIIKVQEKEIQNKTVEEIRSAGVSHIPEDRYKWGSAVNAAITETAIMAHHNKDTYSKHGILFKTKIKDFTTKLIEKYNVKAKHIQDATGSLSGGNAQKLIVARELSQDSSFIIASEPTRGVDIGAMEFIHQQIINKRNEGNAILLVTSELSEILKLSDRIYVMYDGKIVGEFERGNVTEEKLGLLMAGGIA